MVTLKEKGPCRYDNWRSHCELQSPLVFGLTEEVLSVFKQGSGVIFFFFYFKKIVSLGSWRGIVGVNLKLLVRLKKKLICNVSGCQHSRIDMPGHESIGSTGLGHKTF